MGAPIDLDRQAGGVAKEVEDVGPDRMLAAELEATGAGTKEVPKPRLRRAHLPA